MAIYYLWNRYAICVLLSIYCYKRLTAHTLNHKGVHLLSFIFFFTQSKQVTANDIRRYCFIYCCISRSDVAEFEVRSQAAQAHDARSYHSCHFFYCYANVQPNMTYMTFTEVEVNSGGYLPSCEAARSIFTTVHLHFGE